MDALAPVCQIGGMKTKIELDDNEWGQIIDGLTCRAILYEETVGYYEDGVSYGEIAEVSNVKEARELAAMYRSIIEKIQRQR